MTTPCRPTYALASMTAYFIVQNDVKPLTAGIGSHEIHHPLLIIYHLKMHYSSLLSLAISITKEIEVWPHYQRILYKFLHTINKSISVSTWHKSTPSIIRILICELCISHRDRALIRNSEHAHPPAEDAQGIHSVE